MAKDKDKLINSAQRLAQRGQIQKAIREYLKVLEIDKKDVKAHQRLGDLYLKIKKKDEAVKHYQEAAKHYVKTGFYSKAIAIYKHILELEPDREDVILSTADLYQRMGMVGEAMNLYQKVAGFYENDGRLKEALDIYRKMAELDPRNVGVLTKLAELYYKNGLKKEGYDVFKRALEELKEQNRFEEYVRLMERLAKADPDNLENLKELAEIYIRRKVYDRAYAVLTRIYQKAPDDVKALSQLAQVCVKLERKEEAIVRFKELAKAYQSQGLRQRAREALQRVLELDPNDPLAKKAVGATAPASEPEPEEEVVELEEEVPEVLEEEAEAGIEELDEAVEEEEAVITAPAEPEEEAPEHLSPEQIQEHLTEADVYLKYGLRDKALTHIKIVLKVDPENIEALKRLKNIELEKKNQKGAIDVLRQIASIAKKKNDWQALKESAEEILKFIPDDKDATSWLVEAEEGLKKPKEPEVEVVAEEPEIIAEEPEVIAEEPEVIAEEPEVIEEAQPETAPAVIEEEEFPEVIEEEAPSEAEAPQEAKAPEEEVVEEVVISGRPAQPQDFSEEIEEAEFFVHQGLEEEALRVYLEILQKDPTNKQALKRVKELEEIIEKKKAEAKPEEAIPAPAPSPERARAGEEEIAEEAPAVVEEIPAEIEQEVPVEVEEMPEVIEEEVVVEAPSEAEEAIPSQAPEAVEEAELEEEIPAQQAQAEQPAPEAEEIVEEQVAPEAVEEVAPPEIEEEPVVEEEIPAPSEQAEEIPAVEQEEIGAQEAVEEAEPAPVLEAEEVPSAPEAPPVVLEAEAERPAEQAPPAPSAQQTILEEKPAKPGFEKAPEEVPTQAPPPPAEDFFSAEEEGVFDLAAELEKEDLGPAPEVEGLSTSEKYSFEDMFKEFKEGVSKVVSEEDGATHYDLGIAYKEMGLYNDAIQEFKTALKAGFRPADCYLMIGLCHYERGKYEQAIEEYEKGLTASEISDKEKSAFFYELGQAWMGLGDTQRALKMFEKCQNIDPNFRDVEDKVNELRARISGAPKEMPSAPSREEVSWESAALEEPEAEQAQEAQSEEKGEKKKKGKKIGYV